MELLPILEGVMHVDDEGRVDGEEELLLIHDALDALFCEDSDLHCTYIDFSISFIANYFFFFMCSTFHTFPKPPFPIMYR